MVAAPRAWLRGSHCACAAVACNYTCTYDTHQLLFGLPRHLSLSLVSPRAHTCWTAVSAMGRKRGRDGFQVVPAGYNSRAPVGGRGGGRGRGDEQHGPNVLRQAHSGAMGKIDGLWFRKCGHGERLFREYYGAPGSPIPPQDWDSFFTTLRQKLPVTFRFRMAVDSTARSKFEERLRALGGVAPVAWAPPEAGVWQVKADMRSRSHASPAAGTESAEEGLSALLAEGVSLGLLNRQECVSMLPVMALRVPAGSCVLDVCASPGQKTIQLLEAVSASLAAGDVSDGGGDGGRGCVIANDAHPKRVQALISALDRHARPASERRRLLVTCHRGESFPSPTRPFRKHAVDACVTSAADGGAAAGSTDERLRVGFDRVLADVPCSGDGTIRKDRSVLPRWTPAVGTQLHATQLEIAWRGLELLRVGGRMVYSTCSLNPIEDEAVVAALLLRAEAIAPGAVSVEKWPQQVLPRLRRRSGLSTWRVADHIEVGHAPPGEEEEEEEEEVRLRWHASYEAAVAAGMPHATPTLWPPPHSRAAAMHLDRCSRLLPHDQDTGGFFVALLRKHRSIDAPPDAAASTAAQGGGGGKTSLASSQAIPQLPQEDELAPLSISEADELGARLGVSAPRRRLLRARSAATLEAVSLAPRAITAFAPGSVCVARAGLMVAEEMA